MAEGSPAAGAGIAGSNEKLYEVRNPLHASARRSGLRGRRDRAHIW